MPSGNIKIKSLVDLYYNLFRFYEYLKSDKEEEREFAKRQTKKSSSFFALRIDDTYIFAPTLFLIFRENTIGKNINTDEIAQEDQIIVDATHAQDHSSRILSEKLVSFFRHYQVGDGLKRGLYKIFYHAENIDNLSPCYFVNTTHVPNMKPSAWKNFKNLNIAAIGWHHIDYSLYESQETINHILSLNTSDENDALRSFDLIKKVKEGDVICVFNVNHGLFGIGIVASKYKFQRSIHDTCAVTKEEWYSHYVEVAWVNSAGIDASDILFDTENPMWPVFGTLHIRIGIPSYVKKLLL